MWRIRCSFDVVRSDGTPATDGGSGRLEQEMAATGTVRVPWVRLIEGQALLMMLVRGTDEMEASLRALSTVDVAAAQVPGLTLGELRKLTAALVVPREAG